MLDEVNVYMASRGIFSLFFYLTTSICLAHSSVNGCLNDPASPHALGEITADTLLEEGQPIAINCTLSKEQAVLRGRNVIFNSSDILYEFESSRINNSQIIRPNSRTAIINITKSSIKNSGHYYCYLEVEKIVSFICSMHLEVGRKLFSLFSSLLLLFHQLLATRGSNSGTRMFFLIDFAGGKNVLLQRANALIVSCEAFAECTINVTSLLLFHCLLLHMRVHFIFD